MGRCINRIIVQWQPIVDTFEQLSENDVTARQLLNKMTDPVTKCYQCFLNYILPTVENLNGWLQTERVILPEVYSQVKDALLDILDCYIDENYLSVTNISEIEMDNPIFFKNIHDIDIGHDAVELAAQLNQEQWENFMSDCLNYLEELAKQI